VTTYGRRKRIRALLSERAGIKVNGMARPLGVIQGTIRYDPSTLLSVPSPRMPRRSPTTG
jgi:DeoR/GlpR family transcriptional regulator of sugar metabolism